MLTHEPLGHDLILPVPLHSDRKGERGFNQAELLAEALALLTDRPIGHEALFRVRNTLPQVRLGIAERRRNVRGAFRASARAVAGRRVLLVDDVATTGATLEACARALRAAEAASVWGLVLARER